VIDSFRTEFRDVAAWAQTLPRPTVHGAAVPVAVLYGVGAHWLATALLQTVSALVSVFVELPLVQVDEVVRRPLPIREAITFLAAVAGMAVAFRAGRWRGAVGLAAVFVVTTGGGFLIWRSECARMPIAMCDAFTDGPVQQLPEVMGGLVGLLAAGLVRVRAARPSPILLAAAVIALSYSVVRVAVVPLPIAEDYGQSRSLASAAASALTMVLAGVVAARLRGGAWTATALTGALILPWLLVSARSWAAFGLPQLPPDVPPWQMFTPVLFALLLIAAWSITTRWPRTT